VKSQEMRAIVRKRQRRKLVEVGKGELVFKVRGHQVDPQKIERWMKRHEVVDSLLYVPSPAACKYVCNGYVFLAHVLKPLRLPWGVTQSLNEDLQR
jgi:hypothetical protein